VYLIDPTLRRDFQTLSFRAAAVTSGALEWRVDDRVVARADAGLGVDWPLIAGRHIIAVRDGNGQSADVAIIVK